ncbi:MAG: hypothetical protein IT456_11310 [Planctomycetes bacterium]|nr:hypothetical protein [Planctomycetota bacterium]
MDRDPDHPIISKPWECSIGEFHYHVGLDGSEPFLDLSLHRGEVVRRLRFWSPQQLKIEDGFPSPTHGMAILDVGGRGLEGLRVRVVDFEASGGAVTFWARCVVDLDTMGTG